MKVLWIIDYDRSSIMKVLLVNFDQTNRIKIIEIVKLFDNLHISECSLKQTLLRTKKHEVFNVLFNVRYLKHYLILNGWIGLK